MRVVVTVSSAYPAAADLPLLQIPASPALSVRKADDALDGVGDSAVQGWQKRREVIDYDVFCRRTVDVWIDIA